MHTNLITAWKDFFQRNPWSELIGTKTGHASACGTIYELPNYLKRANESIAIADMRSLAFTQPHYHPEVEVYFMLQGNATVVVNGKIIYTRPGDSVVIPSQAAHFTIPDNECLIAVVSTPPFNPQHSVALSKADRSVGFDHEQFLSLTNAASLLQK